TCSGAVWSDWAGKQPSTDAFGFDGYTWLLDGSVIAGAPAQSYTPTAADAGHQLACSVTVTYTLLNVTVSVTSSAVTVKGAWAQLADLAAAASGVGPGPSLADKVGQVEDDLAAGDTAGACGTLNAFVDEVNAQLGKKIAAGHAASLTAQAENIAGLLGC